jgi:hypothetical protein
MSEDLLPPGWEAFSQESTGFVLPTYRRVDGAEVQRSFASGRWWIAYKPGGERIDGDFLGPSAAIDAIESLFPLQQDHPLDAELLAIASCVDILSPLSPEARYRVVQWLWGWHDEQRK